MELDQVIKERKSVRKFKNLQVPWYLITECLDAATQAPSSGNVQNWRFIVIRNKESIAKISKMCDEQHWLLKAPVLIVVASDTTKISKLYGVRGEALYAVQNCASAIQNMLLKSHELGLGSVWIGAFDEISLKEFLNISPEVRPQAILALGYPDTYDHKPKRDPLEAVVSFEKYGQKEDKERGKLIPISDTLKKSLHKLISKKH